MNKAELIGNLTRDPEVRTTQSGVTVATFTLAVQRKFANAQGVKEADFIPIVAWRQLGELCGRYLSKGNKAAVTGSIQTRSYDAQDGTKRYVTEIIADEVDFLSPSTANTSPGTPPPPEPPAYGSPQRPEQTRMDTSGFTEVEEDDLPF